jgi:ADP-heptose:LPS heptosyltransferase
MAEGRVNNWPLYRAACYLGGRGVSFGSPLIAPQATAEKAYSVVVDVIQNGRTAVMDKSFQVFQEESLDHVYISPRLEVIEEQEEFLREASRKLKFGKHLVVHITERFKEEPGLFPIIKSSLLAMIGRVGKWQQKICYQEGDTVLWIGKRLKGKPGILPETTQPTKRACVVRFGALGDAIILTPLLEALHKDGYHVTFVGSVYCAPVLENNPYVDNFLWQEREMVPNAELGQYWELWSKEYTKYINLSESLEGDLLVVEGRPAFFTKKSWRHSRCNKNYYDYTLKRGGYDLEGQRGQLYFTQGEERRWKEFARPLEGKFTILWALNGSSHHKVYPLMEPLLRKLFEKYPDIICITVGDDLARLLEFEHPQLLQRAGQWSIRESLIATKYVDLVVGPETMVLNASGCFTTPKITLLSHSTHENLCKHWENDYCLSPDKVIAPCYPCHSLHYSRESCPIGTILDTSTGEEVGKSPLCPIAILPTRLLSRIEEVYNNHFKKD